MIGDAAVPTTAPADTHTTTDLPVSAAAGHSDAPTKPIKVAFFEGTDFHTTAQADAGRQLTIRIAGMGDVPVREIHSITSKDLNTHLQHCRAKSDHNVAHKFFRRHIEGSNIDLLELAR